MHTAAPCTHPLLSLECETFSNLSLTWLPSATMHAPVSVAMSTTAWTLHFSWAYHSASASVSRPSASVLFTCRPISPRQERRSSGMWKAVGTKDHATEIAPDQAPLHAQVVHLQADQSQSREAQLRDVGAPG